MKAGNTSSVAAANGNNYGDSAVPTCGDVSDDDDYYMEQMALILDAHPKTGPPGHPCRVSGHVYIGNQENADDLDLLPAIGITHVLNMAGTRNFDVTRSPYKPSVGVKAFLMIQAEDYDEYDIASHFPDAIAFLDRARASGGQALVHCNLGVNRSGAVVAAYLMISERRPLLRVIADLKARRSLIIANVGFRRQLVRYARCRGYLDPVDRKPTPAQPIGRSLATFDETSSSSTSKTEKSVTSRGNSAVNLLNGETKKNGYHVVNNLNDDVPKYSSLGNSNGESNGLQRYFRTMADNGECTNVMRNGHYTSSNVADLVAATRRERLLNDVDAVIEKISKDDCDDETDSHSSTDFGLSSRIASSSRLQDGFHRVESSTSDNSSSLVDSFVSDKSRTIFDSDSFSVPSVSCSASADYLTLPISNRFESSSSLSSCGSSYRTGGQTLIEKTASAPRLALTVAELPSTFDSYGITSTNPVRIGRPLSAHSLTTGASTSRFESDTRQPAFRYQRRSRSGYRRDNNDDEDDVISFLAEVDKRALISRSTTHRVTTPSLLTYDPHRRSSVPDSIKTSNSTDALRPLRRPLVNSFTEGSVAMNGRRYNRISPTPRLTTSRLLADMTDQLSLDDDVELTSYSLPPCGRFIPTRISAAPGRYSAASGYSGLPYI